MHGSNSNYHFIIKELEEEFIDLFTSLGAKAKKYITVSVPIEKQVKRTGKNW